ncbi:hypothetical protein VNO77_28388 [Canavalia gladiata]|uniref:Bifunctional inhibitor/plant lipid transfer protein/seed storage helical domain-containing protein n=1 Tax=Canavalia gladiata TaxID=3824 RepID=A0AAN9KX61_CANGL
MKVSRVSKQTPIEANSATEPKQHSHHPPTSFPRIPHMQHAKLSINPCTSFPIKTKSRSTKMPKLTIPIIPLVAVLLLVAHTCCASKWQEHDSSCSKQLERVNLRHCERHIREKMERDDDERNYIRKQREGEHEEKCCDELSELNSARCQCRAMQKIMEMEGQSQKLQGLEKLQMEKELMNLPMSCGLGESPLFGCDLSQED